MGSNQRFSLIFTLTALLSVVAIYLQLNREGRTNHFDALLMQTEGKVQKHLYYFSTGLRALFDQYLFLVNANQQNQVLRKQVSVLQAELAEEGELRRENDRLQKLLGLQQVTKLHLLAARVIGHDVSSDFVNIRIDQGLRNGVGVGMGVVSPGGVVGRVFRVTQDFADVVTLIDPTSNIDALIDRSRARGIVTGELKDLSCRLKYIDRAEDVQVHDTVVASGFKDIFPRGALIGSITSVSLTQNGILQNIVVSAAVDVYRLEEVLVVFPPH